MASISSNSSHTSQQNVIKCPHCDKLCNGSRGKAIHISKAHPNIHIQVLSQGHQNQAQNSDPTNREEQNVSSQNSSALQCINDSLRACNGELERMLSKEQMSLDQLDPVVKKVTDILAESKDKLPGPKHPATKFYEARKRRATFCSTNPGNNFQTSTNPERRSKNERKRRRDKYNFELMQHLFFYSRKKAVRMLMGSNFASENCSIALDVLFASYKARWDSPNSCTLQSYGPAVPDTDQHQLDAEYCTDISEEEIEKCVKGINNDTSAGLDGVAIKSIKMTNCYKTLALIGSVMQKFNLVPTSFRKARTVLIYKKGPKEDPGNWRPISICSVLRRIIERVLDKRLNEFLVLNENQVGFSSSPGTYINTSILNACLMKAKREKIDCAVVLLDVQKAFEDSSHAHILKKLENCPIPAALRSLTGSLLKNNSTQLQTKSGTSQNINIEKGVFQGLPLSPKMFNLSIDHVLEAVNENEVSAMYGFQLNENVTRVAGRGFADDLCLIGKSETCVSQLTKIACDELEKVGYRLNYDKCVLINIKKGQLTTDSLQFDGKTIKSIEKNEVIKYLGITFSDEIVFKPDVVISKFNKDLQNLMSTQMLYPHQKLAIINQYIWPCLIYSLQNAPLTKIPQAFLDDLDKMIRTTVKSIIGIPHDTPNSMLYAPKKLRGLQIIRPSWEAFLQHYNICISLLKSNDKFVPYCRDLDEEMDFCINKLGFNKQDIEQEFQRREKTKPSTVMREKLRENEFRSWSQLPQKGIGVEVFEECPTINQTIMNKEGLTNSEWITTLKMSCNNIAVRSIPGRSTTDNPQCRRCNERETLPHVLGSCHAGDLLRNSRHHEIRTIIAKQLKIQGWTVHEELHCVADGGSNRRVDIWCYRREINKGFIIDPTVRMETSKEQAHIVDQEKKAIYEPCISYFQQHYQIQEISVIGVLVGARGAVTKNLENFRKIFNLPKSMINDIVITAIRGSCRIIHNHLYKPS